MAWHRVSVPDPDILEKRDAEPAVLKNMGSNMHLCSKCSFLEFFFSHKIFTQLSTKGGWGGGGWGFWTRPRNSSPCSKTG